MRTLPLCLLLGASLWTSVAHAETVYGRIYDTMSGELFPNTRVVFSNPNGVQETVTDRDGAYWLRDIKPGPYVVRIYAGKRGEIVGRALVYPKRPTTLLNLDLGKIDAPAAEDQY